MSTLSAFLVQQLSQSQPHTLSMTEIKNRCRDLSQEYFKKHPQILEQVARDYDFYIKKDFTSDRDEYINGVADHYAEKIYSYNRDLKEYEQTLNNIQPEPADALDSINEDLKKRPVIFFTGHFGGVDLIPSKLAFKGGGNVSVFLRYKSEQAKKATQRQREFLNSIPGLDVNLVNQASQDESFREVRYIRKQNRILFTVLDAFEHWKIDQHSKELPIFSRKAHTDSTPTRLVNLLQPAVYYGINHRVDGEHYKLKIKKLADRPQDFDSASLFREWCQTVENKPSEWYIWNEIIDLKPHVIPS